MQRSSRLLSTLPKAFASSSTPAHAPFAGANTPAAALRQVAPLTASRNIPSKRTAATAAAKTAPAGGSKSSYSRYAPAASSTTSRTTKKAAAAPSTSIPPEIAIDPTFPVPQPAAALPDYAALAPPLDPPTTPIPPSHPITLSEAAGFDVPAESAYAESDWSKSFHGLSSKPFDKEVAQVLMRPLNIKDIEIKPDGLLYLPEIKYRRTLNEAFGPGGWGMAPRGETTIGQRIISREWGLVCLGRLVSVARGEQEYFSIDGIPTAIEASKSNAVLRCCKDLGIASELWDPTFIKDFKKKYCTEVMVEHITQKKKRKLWRKKEDKFDYPYKEL